MLTIIWHGFLYIEFCGVLIFAWKKYPIEKDNCIVQWQIPLGILGLCKKWEPLWNMIENVKYKQLTQNDESDDLVCLFV